MLTAALPAAARSAEQGHDQHHRDDAQILEDQRADDEAAVRGVELAALGERAQHDGRAREREDEAVEDGAAEGLPERQRHARRRRGGEAHLQRAAERDLAEDVAQPGERELEADGEQQQHDADLGQHLDCVHRRRQPESEGPEQRAGRQQPRHRRAA